MCVYMVISITTVWVYVDLLSVVIVVVVAVSKHALSSRRAGQSEALSGYLSLSVSRLSDRYTVL